MLKTRYELIGTKSCQTRRKRTQFCQNPTLHQAILKRVRCNQVSKSEPTRKLASLSQSSVNYTIAGNTGGFTIYYRRTLANEKNASVYLDTDKCRLGHEKNPIAKTAGEPASSHGNHCKSRKRFFEIYLLVIRKTHIWQSQSNMVKIYLTPNKVCPVR